MLVPSFNLFALWHGEKIQPTISFARQLWMLFAPMAIRGARECRAGPPCQLSYAWFLQDRERELILCR
jgi:hypothetical protein